MYLTKIKACHQCVQWFDLYLDKLELVEPGPECEYCTDLTQRPNYKPEVA